MELRSLDDIKKSACTFTCKFITIRMSKYFIYMIMYVCMYVCCMHVRMYVCMYVYVCCVRKTAWL